VGDGLLFDGSGWTNSPAYDPTNGAEYIKSDGSVSMVSTYDPTNGTGAGVATGETVMRNQGMDRYFLHSDNHASITGYEQVSTASPDDSPTTKSAASGSSSKTIIEEFATDALGWTTLPGGQWTFNTYCRASNATGRSEVLIYVLARAADDSETTLGQTTTGDLDTDPGADPVLIHNSIYIDNAAIAATDMIVVKYFALCDQETMKTLYVYIEGTQYGSSVITPWRVPQAVPTATPITGVLLTNGQIDMDVGYDPTNGLSVATVDYVTAHGGGDMTKAVYDADDDGEVTNAEGISQSGGSTLEITTDNATANIEVNNDGAAQGYVNFENNGKKYFAADLSSAKTQMYLKLGLTDEIVSDLVMYGGATSSGPTISMENAGSEDNSYLKWNIEANGSAMTITAIATPEPTPNAVYTFSASEHSIATNHIKLNPIATPVATPEGMIYYDDDVKKPYYYNGTSWLQMSLARTRTMYFAGASALISVSNPATAPTQAESSTNKLDMYWPTFSASADNAVEWTGAVPDDYGTQAAGYPKCVVCYYADGTDAEAGHAVDWIFSSVKVASGAAFDAAVGNTTINTASAHTAAYIYQTASTEVSIADAASGNVMQIRLMRNGDGVNDSYTGTCKLAWIKILYTSDGTQ
jgi:hypothetical protein